MIFLAELNVMETWATDIGNAYLEAETTAKVYIIAGPEFGEQQGHLLVIRLRWHERLSDCLCKMGFTPCKAEADIWMHCVGEEYEYIAVYVDDLRIASLNPENII